MTRHAAYAVRSNGLPARHPFASFPHADAARRWVAAHPDTRVRFVPELPPEADDDARRLVADMDARHVARRYPRGDA